MNFDLDLLIRVPHHKAFEYLVKPEHLVQWVNDLEAFELDNATALAKGVTFKQTMREGGSTKVYTGSVESFDPPRELSVMMDTKSYQMLTVYRLRPDELGTQMKVITKFFPKSAFSKGLGMVFSRMQKRRFTRDMERMRAFWEESFAAFSPPPRRPAKSPEFLPGEPHLDPGAKNANPL